MIPLLQDTITLAAVIILSYYGLFFHRHKVAAHVPLVRTFHSHRLSQPYGLEGMGTTMGLYRAHDVSFGY